MSPAVAQDGATTDELLQRINELEQKVDQIEQGGAAAPAGEAPAEAEKEDLKNLEVKLPWWDMKVKIGGQVRLRGEFRTPLRSYAVGAPGAVSLEATDFIVQRTRLSFDFTVNKHLRAFIELQDSRFWGDNSTGTGAGLTNANGNQRFFLRQGYMEFKDLFDLPIKITAGRYKLQDFGDKRLISSLDWANVTRAWDGVDVHFSPEGWKIDLFAQNIREGQLFGNGDAENNFDENDDFWFSGIYVSNRMVAKHELDGYLFWRHLSDRVFTNHNGRMGDRKDFTIGTRLKGGAGPLGYTTEWVYQWGDQAGDRISAWATATTLWAGFKMGDDMKFKILTEYAFASGDADPTDRVNKTFDPLLPFGHFYHGHMDLILWRNMHTVNFQLAFTAMKGLSFHSNLHFFWLDKVKSPWFGIGFTRNAGPTGRDGNGNHVRSFIGTELDLFFKYKLWKNRLFLWGGYSHFWNDKYIRDTGSPTRDMDWLFLQAQVTF